MADTDCFIPGHGSGGQRARRSYRLRNDSRLHVPSSEHGKHPVKAGAGHAGDAGKIEARHRTTGTVSRRNKARLYAVWRNGHESKCESKLEQSRYGFLSPDSFHAPSKPVIRGSDSPVHRRRASVSPVLRPACRADKRCHMLKGVIRDPSTLKGPRSHPSPSPIPTRPSRSRATQAQNPVSTPLSLARC